MARFYLSEGLVSAEIGDLVFLRGTEAQHAVVVSRLQPGETVMVGNGAGLIVTGTVLTAQREELVLRVESVAETPPSNPAIWLVQALAKGDRDELAVQAATELGVDGVIPWAASRSVVRWTGPKADKGHDRWRSIVREAVKQSLRPRLPEVGRLASTEDLVVLAAATRMLILDPDALEPLTGLRPDGRDSMLVVGPEGGIAPEESERLVAAGALPVRLGDTVLRTSTAGPAAIAVLNAQFGRW